ncbi:hypothetical protein KEG38_23620 [Polyangium jinanense]|uniref:hypothetical protein n=1 Tax=Polyangium jinanense TaxID=2829994 RepID=UPI002341482B|nr:hypothetical protein [Polyangium jinanense]MDC3956869.1 hypothetical protein [Polyangium jinanense]
MGRQELRHVGQCNGSTVGRISGRQGPEAGQLDALGTYAPAKLLVLRGDRLRERGEVAMCILEGLVEEKERAPVVGRVLEQPERLDDLPVSVWLRHDPKAPHPFGA